MMEHRGENELSVVDLDQQTAEQRSHCKEKPMFRLLLYQPTCVVLRLILLQIAQIDQPDRGRSWL